MIEIRAEDIVEEINYWSLCVALYVYGANPKISMIDGYARRLWGALNVDKVIPVKLSMFMVRFLNDEAKEKALNSKYLMFDSHPVFIKQWHEDIQFDPNEFRKVPVWVQLPELPLRYWGCIMKLTRSIGEPIQLDTTTKNRDRIHFARVLINMDITKDFPKHIKFKNEKGNIMEQRVTFEWQPHTHMSNDLPRKKMTQVWKPKEKQQGRLDLADSATSTQAEDLIGTGAAVQQQPNRLNTNLRQNAQLTRKNTDEDGFQLVTRRSSSPKQQHTVERTETNNPFAVIQVEDGLQERSRADDGVHQATSNPPSHG
ncbi:Glycogen synthase [Bienertia sinuspersici]